MYNQPTSHLPGSTIPNSTMPNSGLPGSFPGGQPGLAQPTSILNAPQGEFGGLLGPGIPQNKPLSAEALLGTKPKGTILFRPIEARFDKDHDIVGKMDPYCKFKIGMHSGKSSVAKSEGVNPTWGDSIPVKYKGQSHAKLTLKDKDKLRPDSRLGAVKIPLDQVLVGGPTTQWYRIEKGTKTTGEIHLEISFQPKGSTVGAHGVGGTHLGGQNVTGTHYVGGTQLGGQNVTGTHYVGGTHLGGQNVTGIHDVTGHHLGGQNVTGTHYVGGTHLGGQDIAGTQLGSQNVAGTYVGTQPLGSTTGHHIPGTHTTTNTL